jgi:aldehyde:ferredoxin oxidoreductase
MITGGGFMEARIDKVMGGTSGKVLFVNLTEQSSRVETVPTGDYEKYLGSRGMAARYYRELIEPETDPLSAENRLIFFTGPLTGTQVPASTKFGLATKSPETGRYLCSNASGDFGPYLKQNGFDGLILEGEAGTPVGLVVTEGKIEFRDASEDWGKTVEEATEHVKQALGARTSVMSIGPAGENLVRFACIQVDGRSFGRGGGGAVMGKKKVKYVALASGEPVSVFDAQGLKKAFAQLSSTARKQKIGLVEYGTAQLIEIMNEAGALPTRNFDTAEFDGIGKIDSQAMKDEYWVKNTSCYRCPVSCAKVCTVKEGPYAGATSDPEYETIWAFGAHCGISDFGVIIKANKLCDDYGMDTISAGYLAGFAMELSDKAEITAEETRGKKLTFGDPDSLVRALELMARREGIGKLLADGCLGIIKEKPHWEESLVHVKGMPFPAYEPRALKGMGLALGTSSRGACHNVGGWTISDELGSGKYDRYALEGKGELVSRLQNTRAYIDSLGVCTQVRKALGFIDKPEEVVLKQVTGADLTPKLMEIGERVYNLERLIMVAEGVDRSADQLPKRMSVPLREGRAKGQSLNPDEFGIMLDEYYHTRGWNEQGVPTEETIKRLGL